MHFKYTNKYISQLILPRHRNEVFQILSSLASGPGLDCVMPRNYKFYDNIVCTPFTHKALYSVKFTLLKEEN